MSKMLVSELERRLGEVAMTIFGPRFMLRIGSKWEQAHSAGLSNYLDSFIKCIAGGTNEIQRNIIATRGLDLPR